MQYISQVVPACLKVMSDNESVREVSVFLYTAGRTVVNKVLGVAYSFFVIVPVHAAEVRHQHSKAAH